MSIGDDDFGRTTVGEESGNKSCLVMGIIFGGLGGAMLLCGGCCFGSFYFRMNSVAGDIESDLQDNDVMAEQIGEIELLEAEVSNSNPFTDRYVFRVTGSQNSGTITADCVEDDVYSEIPAGTTVEELKEKFGGLRIFSCKHVKQSLMNKSLWGVYVHIRGNGKLHELVSYIHRT